ncbi:MAG: SDR family oxidoreductase [Rhodospirillales bacterium]|nr:SDR family oxidoreductase [Rhodospirillales bacterium]
MTGQLNEMVAIVTGGSSGIGRGIVQRFHEEGAHVLTCSRRKPGTGLPPGVVWQQADVARQEDVEALHDAALNRFGRIDVLVNNAGVEIDKTLPETTNEDWDELIGANVRGVFLCCRAVIPTLQRSGGGSIINIGSISGYHADPAMAIYNASKGFVHALTRSIAVDHGRDGIRCNAISPGCILTEMVDQAFAQAADPAAAERDALARHALGRMGRPEDIAAMAVWLASEEAAFVTGQMHIVDGGLTAASPINPALF